MSERRERRTRRVVASSAAARSAVAFLVSASLAVGALVAGSAPATAAPTAATAAAALRGFDPGNIISDAVFFKDDAMTVAEIQDFLVQRVPACASGYTCLKSYKTTSRTVAADAMCAAYSGVKNEPASRIIARVARVCGINPQVILVTLQKEQGLVTSTAPSASRYRIAMGQGCPDTAACDTRYYGFFNQVYGAAWQFKRYANPAGTSNYFTWYAPGRTWNVRYHPNTSCGTSPVFIENQATANLYYYTPYQPNAAALAAGYSTGNSCSSYGNRNFYNYFTDWFGSTQVPGTASVECVVPKSTKAASAYYVVTAEALNARTAPTTLCETDRLSLSAGTVVKAIASWDEWFKVNLGSTERWVHRDYIKQIDDPCYTGSNVTAAKGSVLLLKPQTGRTAPQALCPANGGAAPQGTVVTSTRASDTWIEVEYADAKWWVLRSQTRAATDLCYVPVAAAAATQWYAVTGASVTGRAGPQSLCADGAADIATGTVAKAVMEWEGWIQLEVGDRQLWVQRSQVQSATDPACVQPAEMRPSSGVKVITTATTGRLAPGDTCGAHTKALAKDALVTAVAVAGDWTKVSFGSFNRWVRSATLGSTSSKTTTSQLNLRSKPSTTASIVVTLAKGVKLTVIETRSPWLRVKVGSRTGWVHGSYVK